MPIEPAVIETAKAHVQDDVVAGFDGILTPDPGLESTFSINLAGSSLAEVQVVAASEASVVVVPWVYSCVHTGTFLDIPATYIHFDLRGATFVNVGPSNPNDWMYHRFVDFLCALHHIGVYTSVRPALTVPEYLHWDEQRRLPLS
jgi:hypothetical protein